MSVLAVLIGGALGACARYLTDVAVATRFGRAFPWGTLVVNVVGSFVLGVVLAHAHGDLALLLGTGFCGALTTYSTFASETVGLLGERARGRALAYVLLNLGLGLVAFALGGTLWR